jgi:sec-independent protein translocase protein TatA
MIGDLFDNPWKVLIVAIVLIVLFGSKKLPDAARSLGKSMRILKTEVQDLHGDDAPADKEQATAALPAQPAPPAVPPTQQQIDHLQQQIRNLQQQPAATAPAASEAATVNGAPVPETTQRTQQAG